MFDDVLPLTKVVLALALMLAVSPALADAKKDCLQSEDTYHAVKACSELLSRPNLPASARREAYFSRALAHSKFHDDAKAIEDYTSSLSVEFNAVSLMNRGVIYLRGALISPALADLNAAWAWVFARYGKKNLKSCGMPCLNILYNRARALRVARRDTDSIESCNVALLHLPDWEPCKEFLSEVRGDR